MLRILLLLVAAAGALAQNPVSASFPSSVANDSKLGVAKNGAISTLSAGIDASTTAIPVNAGSLFLAGTIITIDAEKMLVSSIISNTLYVAARGAFGTSAATHSSGAPVRALLEDYHHNVAASEIKAIESWALNSALTVGTTGKDGAMCVYTGSGTNAACLVSPLSNPSSAYAWSMPPVPSSTSVVTIAPATTRSTNDSAKGVPASTAETGVIPFLGTPYYIPSICSGTVPVSTHPLVWNAASNCYTDGTISSMVYPGGTGIPQVSGGSAWGATLGIVTSLGNPGANTNIPTEASVRAAIAASGSMTYPTSGLAVSTGSSWGASVVAGATGHVPRSNGSAYVDAVLGFGDLSGNPTSAQTIAGFTGTKTSAYCLAADGSTQPIGSSSYPGAGIPVSTGSAWGTSLSPGAAGTVPRSNGSAFATAQLGFSDLSGNPTSTQTLAGFSGTKTSAYCPSGDGTMQPIGGSGSYTHGVLDFPSGVPDYNTGGNLLYGGPWKVGANRFNPLTYGGVNLKSILTSTSGDYFVTSDFRLPPNWSGTGVTAYINTVDADGNGRAVSYTVQIGCLTTGDSATADPTFGTAATWSYTQGTNTMTEATTSLSSIPAACAANKLARLKVIRTGAWTSAHGIYQVSLVW